ncbi:MAG: hypothetical protein M0001_03345 [Treponema sp.]|nr:hypothetical protein [Treponema sp.]
MKGPEHPCIIVDTNVVLVSGGQHPDVTSGCVAECVLRLQLIMTDQVVVLDDGFEIVNEYLNKTDPKRQKTAGDVFALWVVRNWKNPKHCALVKLERGSDGEYSSLPQHPGLAGFDAADKKFIAVAAAHPAHPPILQATDSKWLDWAEPLRQCGVEVNFICPEDIERFHRKKFGE